MIRPAPTIEDVDRHVAAFVGIEHRRFTLLGGWVTSTKELDVKAALATHARHHAWHASLWAQHHPERSGYQPPAGGPEGTGLSACLDALAGETGPEDSVERLVGAYRVVAARAVAAYTEHLARLSPVSDAALARTTRLVLADQRADWHEGEALLQRLLDSDLRIERAAVHQINLERLMLAGAKNLG